MFFLIAWLYAIIAIIGGVIYTYTKKPLGKWSWQRKLYFTCWIFISFFSIMYGLRAFIKTPVFNFYAQLAWGVAILLLAIVPCGISFFNSPLTIRILRSLTFVVLGILTIIAAFRP